MGCICLDAACSISECGGRAPTSDLPVYQSVVSKDDVKLMNNVHYRPGGAGRYVNRWAVGLVVPGWLPGSVAAGMGCTDCTTSWHISCGWACSPHSTT